MLLANKLNFGFITDGCLLLKMCISYTILLKILLKTNFFFYLDRKLTQLFFGTREQCQILRGRGFWPHLN